MIDRVKRAVRRWLGGAEESYALGQLDLKLRPFLPTGPGFFVEAGANDGVNQSNTLWLDRHRGWTGLLVEPIPELAERCRVNRPRAIVENVALVPFDFEGDRLTMRFGNLMSVVKGGMRSTEEELAHIEEASRGGLVTYEVEVPAAPLGSLLRKHGVRDIDLLSLDVEGFELQALRGLDLEEHRPALMLIEARYREEIDRYLSPLYEPAAELSFHDVLYRCTTPLRRAG